MPIPQYQQDLDADLTAEVKKKELSDQLITMSKMWHEYLTFMACEMKAVWREEWADVDGKVEQELLKVRAKRELSSL